MSRLTIKGAEHRHLARAARVKEGDEVWLFDGGGSRVLARVESVKNDRTVVQIIGRADAEASRIRLVLAQGLLQAKKMEFILQKASEIGISVFIPLVTARSLKASEEREGRKAERWARIAREATKQSKGWVAPVVHPAERLEDVLARLGEGLRLFLNENGGKPLKGFLLEAESGGGPAAPAVTIFVGPEGGWTEAEERAFREAGCEAVSLGRRILKAETAAIAGVAMIAHFWND